MSKHPKEIEWMNKLDNMNVDEILEYHSIDKKYLKNPDLFIEGYVRDLREWVKWIK